MVFKDFCVLVHWENVASALEGLNQRHNYRRPWESFEPPNLVLPTIFAFIFLQIFTILNEVPQTACK